MIPLSTEYAIREGQQWKDGKHSHVLLATHYHCPDLPTHSELCRYLRRCVVVSYSFEPKVIVMDNCQSRPYAIWTPWARQTTRQGIPKFIGRSRYASKEKADKACQELCDQLYETFINEVGR